MRAKQHPLPIAPTPAIQRVRAKDANSEQAFETAFLESVRRELKETEIRRKGVNWVERLSVSLNRPAPKVY